MILHGRKYNCTNFHTFAKFWLLASKLIIGGCARGSVGLQITKKTKIVAMTLDSDLIFAMEYELSKHKPEHQYHSLYIFCFIPATVTRV